MKSLLLLLTLIAPLAQTRAGRAAFIQTASTQTETQTEVSREQQGQEQQGQKQEPQEPQTYLQYSGSDPQTTRGASRLLHYLPQDMPITVYVPIPDARRDDASGGALTGGFSAGGFGAGGSGGDVGASGALTGGFGIDVSEVDRDAARRDEVVRALNAWQEAVPDLIRFRTAETPEESALKVVWQDLPSDKVGSYRYTFSVLEGGIYRFRATEILLDPDTPPDDLYRYALLEIGHALGLLGRSPFEGDAMSAVPSGRVSERDVATLRALYALPSGIVLRK